jgi:hypothetical protein
VERCRADLRIHQHRPHPHKQSLIRWYYDGWNLPVLFRIRHLYVSPWNVFLFVLAVLIVAVLLPNGPPDRYQNADVLTGIQ